MAAPNGFHVRRVYDQASPDDGVRVLVDRLWPRGLAKDRAAVDEWAKEVTPSDELRRFLHKDASRYEEFAARYREELAAPAAEEAAAHLREEARDHTVTLLTAVKNPDTSHVPVLLEHLQTP